MSKSRRQFLTDGSKSLAGIALFSLGARAAFAEQAASQAPSDLIWYSKHYLTAETPVAQLSSWITPTGSFFVRNNLLLPEVSLDKWRLRVTGEVSRPFELDFRELQRLRSSDVTNTLECAGNGRSFFQPPIAGVPWRKGAVSTAVFSGPTLRELLQRAGLKCTARDVAFTGLDVVPPGAEPFIRSIPIAKALDPNTLVALRINGVALTPEHGFPARALVPGWIGSCSIKWLCEIRVLEREFSGFYMKSAYRLPEPQSSAEMHVAKTRPLTSLIVKSIITFPRDGAILHPDHSNIIRIRGLAWAGEHQLKRQQFSFDGGRNWRTARFDPAYGRYAWRTWTYDWKDARAGEYVLQCRAIDDHGMVQPPRPAWNPSGYLWNGIDEVRVTVRSA